MPETTPPLYDAWTTARADLEAFEAKVVAERAELASQIDAAEAALAAELPEGELRSPIEGATTFLKRVGQRIELVTIPFLAHPIESPAAVDVPAPDATAPAAPAAPEGV